MRGPFKQVVLKAIAGITALEGAPRGGEVVVFVCLAQVSVTSKHPEVISHLGEYRDLASIKPWIPLNWSPTLRIFALSPGIVSVLNGVRFWGASLLFMMDSNAIWKRDAERIDT